MSTWLMGLKKAPLSSWLLGLGGPATLTRGTGKASPFWLRSMTICITAGPGYVSSRSAARCSSPGLTARVDRQGREPLVLEAAHCRAINGAYLTAKRQLQDAASHSGGLGIVVAHPHERRAAAAKHLTAQYVSQRGVGVLCEQLSHADSAGLIRLMAAARATRRPGIGQAG